MFDFKGLLELLAYFKDEKTCRRFYAYQRWEDEIVCPHCGSTKTYITRRGYKCGDKNCYKKFSVTTGTIFENSKIPLRTWFAAIYLITSHRKGISSLQLHRDLNVSQKTAWFLLHRIREMLQDNQPDILGDESEIEYEVDETYVGGKNKNRHADKKIPYAQGRSTKDKTAVFGVLQRNGYVVTYPVPDTSSTTLQPIIRELAVIGSTVYSDEWKAYTKLNYVYNHEIVRHGAREYVVGKAHTNNIENYWSQFKRGIIGVYHHLSPEHLHRYCNEFTYRYNRRKLSEAEKFNLTLQRCEGVRLKYNDLVQH